LGDRVNSAFDFEKKKKKGGGGAGRGTNRKRGGYDGTDREEWSGRDEMRDREREREGSWLVRWVSFSVRGRFNGWEESQDERLWTKEQVIHDVECSRLQAAHRADC
jgi:hypothetical protein